jgi:membrane-bound inhibitor of C-type lysozyme
LTSRIELFHGPHPPGLATKARHACGGDGKLSADFSPPDANKGEVKFTFGNGARSDVAADRVSADGERYANGDIEFWIKGRKATLIMRGEGNLRGAMNRLEPRNASPLERSNRCLSVELHEPELKRRAQTPASARALGKVIELRIVSH